MHNPAATTENLKDEVGGGGRHTAYKQERVEKKERSKNKDKKGKETTVEQGKES